jgi:hypothetical protein
LKNQRLKKLKKKKGRIFFTNPPKGGFIFL